MTSINRSADDDYFEPVFLLAGQSNMVGRCGPGDLDGPIPALASGKISSRFRMCWNNDSNFDTPGTSGGDWKDLQCQPCPGLDGRDCFGPEMGLAEALDRRLPPSTRRAYFLKFAMGSTNLHSNWNPENAEREGKPADIGHYDRFIDFCGASLKSLQTDSGPPRRLMGMLWLQGESDSSKAKHANAYLRNFQRLATAIRRDLDAPDLPVVVSPVVWRGKKVGVVNSALREAGDGGVDNCGCIKELDLGEDVPLVQTDEAGPICAGHLTAEAILDVGRRMGEALPLNEKEPVPTRKQ